MNHESGADDLRETAREKLKAMLAQKSFMERWVPVVAEFVWEMTGKQSGDQRERLLPEYCHNIFKMYGRTIFRTMPPVAEAITVKDQAGLAACKTFPEAAPFVHVDWQKLGSIVGSVNRAAQFFRPGRPTKPGRNWAWTICPRRSTSNLTRSLPAALGGAEQMAKVEALEPGKSFMEISEASFEKQVQEARNLGPLADKLAYEMGPGALAGLKKVRPKVSPIFWTRKEIRKASAKSGSVKLT